MDATKCHVRQDEHGVLRVAETRVMLDSVIAGFQVGHSAETIAQQYPVLSLEEVYGAIAYYLANQAEVDEYLRRQDEILKLSRQKSDGTWSPVLQWLRGLAAQRRANAQ